MVAFYPSCNAAPSLQAPTLFVVPDLCDGAQACDAYMRREHGAGLVKIQRIAPFGVWAEFDCEVCQEDYLGGAGGYDEPASALVKGALFEEVVKLTE